MRRLIPALIVLALCAPSVQALSANDMESIRLLINRGNALLSHRRFSDAIEQYEEVLKIDPGNAVAMTNIAEVHNNWGVQYYTQRDYKNAIEQWQQCLKINPGHIKAKRNIELAVRASAAQERTTPMDDESHARHDTDDQDVETVAPAPKNPSKKAGQHAPGSDIFSSGSETTKDGKDSNDGQQPVATYDQSGQPPVKGNPVSAAVSPGKQKSVEQGQDDSFPSGPTILNRSRTGSTSSRSAAHAVQPGDDRSSGAGAATYVPTKKVSAPPSFAVAPVVPAPAEPQAAQPPAAQPEAPVAPAFMSPPSSYPGRGVTTYPAAQPPAYAATPYPNQSSTSYPPAPAPAPGTGGTGLLRSANPTYGHLPLQFSDQPPPKPAVVPLPDLAPTTGGEAPSAIPNPTAGQSLDDLLTAVEMKVIGQKQSNLTVLQRLENVEKMTDGQVQPGTVLQRIDGLRKRYGL